MPIFWNMCVAGEKQGDWWITSYKPMPYNAIRSFEPINNPQWHNWSLREYSRVVTTDSIRFEGIAWGFYSDIYKHICLYYRLKFLQYRPSAGGSIMWYNYLLHKVLESVSNVRNNLNSTLTQSSGVFMKRSK